MIKTVKNKSNAAIGDTGSVVEKMKDTATHVLATTVKDTAQIGGDVGTAAKELAVGAVKGTKELVVGAEHAGAAVAGGAFKAVAKR